MNPLAPDRIKYRDYVRSLVDLDSAETVVDIGCGAGHDLNAMAGQVSRPDIQFIGIDSSEKRIAEARQQAGSDMRLSFIASNLAQAIPLEDGVADVVYSNNFLECVVDRQLLLREVARILRPGGQVVFAHWDHDTHVFDGLDKNLTRMVVQAFSDWKQDWMESVDGWMGRRLWATFQESGLFKGIVQVYVMTNTEFLEPFHGHETISTFEKLVERGVLNEYSIKRLRQAVQSLAERNQFFYSVNAYVYSGYRRDSR